MSEETKNTAEATELAKLREENATLKEKLAASEKSNTEAQKDLKESLKTVGELSEQLELREQNNDGSRIVKVGNKSYKLLGKVFVTKAGRITADELVKDQAELKRMVKIKSGSLVEVTGKGDED